MIALAALVVLGAPALAPERPTPTADSAAVEITEWRVPWERSRPRDPYVAGDGRVWFVGQVGNYIAVLDPKSGEFRRYELDEGVHPHNLIVDRQGMVWYAGNRAAHIGRLDPATGKVTKYPMPDTAARDPHTLVFDQRGDIWFTVQGGNHVGHLATGTGKVRLIRVPTADARPYGIVVDSRGRPWFSEFGSNKIATVDPATMKLRELTLPDPRARARRLVVTSDDVVWYGDYVRGTTARLDPATGKVEEWPNPSGARSMPYAMAVDDRDRVWYVETGVQPNRLVAFDPKTRTVVSQTEIRESGAGTVRHMVFHAPTREIWFGTDANTIGRAKVR
jgi:virginiamycin B lyase